MPFELPAVPNLTVNPPQQPDLLSQYGKLLHLKTLAGQQQLLPLQVQEAQQRVQGETLQNQRAQMDIDSQRAMVKAWSDPKFLETVTSGDGAKSSGFGFDPNAMVSHLVSNGVLPKDAMALSNMFVERSQKIAATQKDVAQTNEADAATRAKGYQALADRISPILDMPAAKAGEALAALKQDLVKNPKAFTGVPQEDLAHVYGADLEHLPAMATLIGLDGKIAEYHKGQAEAKKAQQGVIPEGGGMSPDTKQAVAKEAAILTNPDVQRGKVQVAAAEGAARANVEHQFATLSNAALKNVPTHLVAPAAAAAEKANNDYAQAKMVSDNIAAIMDAAHKGNVVSYQLLPQEGALQVMTTQGVHRINMAEIANYGGGSLFQRLEGRLGHALTGKSIPDSVLNDMSDIQDVYRKGARSKYENTIKAVNQTYGAEFKPLEMEAPPKAEAKSENTPGSIRIERDANGRIIAVH